MNNDDRISPQPSSDQALEARIVAWIMGEASDFEVAELTRLIAERPSLAEFKARTEATHNLIRQAAAPEAKPLRLSAPRRASLLAALGVDAELTAADEPSGEAVFEKTIPTDQNHLAAASAAAPAPASGETAKAPAKSSVLTYPIARRRMTSGVWIRTLSIACSLMLTFLVLHVTVFTPRFAEHKEAVDLRQTKAKRLMFADETESARSAAAETAKASAAQRRSTKQGIPVQLPSISETRDASQNDPLSYSGNAAGKIQPQKNRDAYNVIHEPLVFGAKTTGAAKENLRGLDAPMLEANANPNSPRKYIASQNARSDLPSETPVNEIPVQLEPFDVKVSEGNGGYAASSTLAGTRIRTELSIPTVDNFLKDIPFDSIRTGLQRGPNSVLLGVGSPSGIVSDPLDYSAKRKSFLAELSSKAERKEPSAPEDVNAALALSNNPPGQVGQSHTWGGVYHLPKEKGTTFDSYETLMANSDKAGTPATAPASSATSPGSNDHESIPLSPFVVSAPEPVGSIASSTLAGTRIRTDLKDAASSIKVVTNDFLKDTDATNSPDLLKYTANEEVGGLELAPSEKGEYEASVDAVDQQAQKKPVAPPTVAKPAVAPKAASTDEQSAQTEPVSTFSLHVSDVSFRLAADQIASGGRPDASAIRPEEFYNAFDYGDPAPAAGEKVNCRIEQSAHPTKQQRNLLRIALRVPSTGRASAQSLRLTILLDTSGSMQRRDRAASVKDAMSALVSLLTPNDRITLIGFSRTPHLLAESVSGDEAQRVISVLNKTPAEGGTNFDAALTLAGELALRQQTAAALNRIVLITDGAANLGDADPKELSTKIEQLRQKGIAFDACGVGTSGVDDAMLETLTRHGDGRYLLLDQASASAEFAKQLAGAFRPAAKNVKVQVRFNPSRVVHYRLLGFAQHRLKQEDFRNDKVDAAELAADEAATALYEIEPLPTGEGALGEVFVRFQDAATGEMVERSWTLPYDAKATSFDHASPSLQLAGTAALVAEYLQGKAVKLDDLVSPINQLRDHYRNEPRVQTLITMFDQLRRIDRHP